MGQLTVATDPQLLSLLVHYLRGICSQSCCSCHKKMGTEQAHLEGECWFACVLFSGPGPKRSMYVYNICVYSLMHSGGAA